MNIEYIFVRDKIVNVIQLKTSQNSKLGLMEKIVTTYHFSLDQVAFNDLTLDSKTCMNCPFSYNQNEGKTGGCYVHKGLMGLGTRSMLNRLHKNFSKLQPFHQKSFNEFVAAVKYHKPSLTRFASYGEPIHLSINEIKALIAVSKNHTGYTHQWGNPKYQDYSSFFRASTSSNFEVNVAKSLGWKLFNVGVLFGGINCPASKESKHKTTCTVCAMCKGNTNQKTTKDIYILKH